MRKTQLIESITQAMGVSGNFKSIIKEEKPVEAAKFELGQANPIEDILGSVDGATVKIASPSYLAILSGPMLTGISPTNQKKISVVKGDNS
jgi:hypothetical protein